MLNEKDVSGMYSKTGRALYEKLHILRKKDEILDPSPKRRLNLNPTAEMDDLVELPYSGTTLQRENTGPEGT